ncbi:MAG: MobF family relaxase [Actinomycetota bacterium]|nr:MobF family relaxase [Actinomycetota bacterium]
MMRVTTLYAATAATTAGYYTRYLTEATGELPGQWLGNQADRLALHGEVTTEPLQALLSGCDPVTGAALGHPLVDRTLSNGKVIRAVAGFDATLSAPKSLSVLWALTGDAGLAECHDIAVRAVADYLERFGATTRVRSNGMRMHPDTHGLTMAAFRQTTSRADDPQLHTHLVISAKVQTADERWLALDARFLKRHQRTLGGLYQSVLRAELSHRYGVAFEPIVNGQAEIAGIPADLLAVFSKRTVEIDTVMADKVAEFYRREGCEPTRQELATMQRQAAADSRARKTGRTADEMRALWRVEAATVGVTPTSLRRSIEAAAADHPPTTPELTTSTVIDALAHGASTWHRVDVMRTICDLSRPAPGVSGERWAAWLDRAVDTVMAGCVDLDPELPEHAHLRTSDGRSIWIEPIASHVTSEAVLAQEQQILDWAAEATAFDPQPSATVERGDLDVIQHEAASAVAGDDPLTLIVGPAGAGKTTMLRAAVATLHSPPHRPVFGFAPTAKAARVLEDETGMVSDTVAKLLYEWSRPDRPPGEWWQLGPHATVVVDEAGMLGTHDLHRLMQLARQNTWRLVLVGDPHQLQAVGRGGMFAELCTAGRAIELERIHRFANPWEATASLQLRHGDTRSLDVYEAQDRIVPGSIEQHLESIATYWTECRDHGQSLAITTTRNEHVDLINDRIQTERWERGELDRSRRAHTADGIGAWVGDLIATRRNDRTLITSAGQFVRNRDQWLVTAIDGHGEITAARIDGGGVVMLPAEYARDHVRVGYAATEPGNQSDTQDRSITLATGSTTGRGLYVGMTRGRQSNHILVVTATDDLGEAGDLLGRVIACDRADVPAVTRRQQLVGDAGVNRSASLPYSWVDEADSRPAPTRAGAIEMN